MSTTSASCTVTSSGLDGSEEVTPQRVVIVYTCTRLGRTANPPGFSFTDWFRPRRNR